MVAVEEDRNTPEIAIEMPAILNCLNEEITIDASQSSSDAVDVQWTSVDQSPIQDANTLMPMVSTAGFYELIITDIGTGCTNSIEIEVTENFAAPELILGLQMFKLMVLPLMHRLR